MSFPVDRWYSWWSWHSLVAVAAPAQLDRPGLQWSSLVMMMIHPNAYDPRRKLGIDLDIVAGMRIKHPQMAIAYERWADLSACTLEPDAGDVKWVQRMWEMDNASRRTPEESLPLDGLLQG